MDPILWTLKLPTFRVVDERAVHVKLDLIFIFMA